MIKLEKKQKIILAIVAFLVIVGIGVYAYYANYQDTYISESTRGNGGLVADYGTALYAEAFLKPYDIEDKTIKVKILDSDGSPVQNFDIKSGETHKVTDLEPGYYTVQYDYVGTYPYKPSTNSSEPIEIVSESKFKEMRQQDAQDAATRREVIAWGQQYYGL